jgi:hypothetical protein
LPPTAKEKKGNGEKNQRELNETHEPEDEQSKKASTDQREIMSLIPLEKEKKIGKKKPPPLKKGRK